jgi:lauroyl/myristoyl acyltransferase
MNLQIGSKIKSAGGHFVSFLVRLLPRRRRFRAALSIARWAEPALRSTRVVRQRVAMRVETSQEVVTYHLLDILTRNGVTFDPIIRVIGIEHLHAALANGRGVLMVAPHAMLSRLILGLLAEMQIEANGVAQSPTPVLGTGAAIRRVIEPSPTLLLTVREILRGNGVVLAMIDRDVVTSRSTFEVSTDRGPLVIADALMQVAFRTEASLVCFAAHLKGGEVVMTLDAPSANEHRSAETITAAVVAFMQQHIAGLQSR